MLVDRLCSCVTRSSTAVLAFGPSPVEGVPSASMLDVSVSVAVFTPVFAWVVAASSDPAPLSPLIVEFTESSHVCTDEHTPFAHAVGDVVFDVAPELVVVVEELCAPATVAGAAAANAATVTTNASNRYEPVAPRHLPIMTTRETTPGGVISPSPVS